MMLPTPIILIIHRPSSGAAYSLVLEKTGARVHIANTLQEANELLSFLHPDLVLLASDMPDGDGRLYCQQIRATLVHPRPVLVLMHSSADVSERIASFRFGADDVLGEPIDSSELAIRVLAHLRRRQEELSSTLTQLPGPGLIRRMLEQCLASTDHPWAILSIDLNNLRVYNETYGDLAGDQLIKALASILSRVVSDNEFVGHLESDDFLLITHPKRCELLAEKICQQFDTISKRFYPQTDADRGYLVTAGRAGVRRRVPLISVSIGVVSSITRRFQSYVDVLTTARDYRHLAKQVPSSYWISDNATPALPAKQEAMSRRILVVEPDGAMACLLQEILSLEGYLVQVTNSGDDALKLARHKPHPDLILLESNLPDRCMDGWQLCRAIKENDELNTVGIAMVTANPDQLAALEAGADLYLPKPFDLPALLSEVNLLLSSRYRHYRINLT